MTPLVLAFSALVACRSEAEPPTLAPASSGEVAQQDAPAPQGSEAEAEAPASNVVPFEAISKAVTRWGKSNEPPRPDLTRITTDGTKVFAPTPEGVAELTIDPDVQRSALTVMRHYEIPEASVVLIDARSGRVLVYANHLEGKPTRDLAALAEAPSASVFKIVTGTALVAEAHHSPQDRTCYNGGEHRISELDLEPNEKRDKYCATLSGAMGRSLNTVFARLAKADLKPEVLEKTARSLQYGSPLPFDVPVAASQIKLPADTLGYARTAAGFWNTTLSPMHAAWISTTLARGGEGVRPHVVERVTAPDGHEVFAARSEPETISVMSKDTAAAVTEMMQTTVTEGTSTRAFHDLEGRSFLPGLRVAGKTGTLTDAEKQRYYTWFTGFVPVEGETTPSVAIAALVVNGPVWRVKANVVAREVLRAYYAKQGAPGVRAPSLTTKKSEERPVAKASPKKSAAPASKTTVRRTTPKRRAVAHR